MLARKGLKLDAAIELKVDAEKLVSRIVNRAAEAKAAGKPVRKDDDPEIFKTRLAAYFRDTAAVTPYYRRQGRCCMRSTAWRAIADVAAAIDAVAGEGEMTEAAAARDDPRRFAPNGAARPGFILLDRPRALNALTLPMVRAIAAALDDFERDARVARVVIASAGGRAFCAGGDIRLLYEQGRAGDHAAQLDFWREEYRLNRRIKRYSKPCVALIDGIVMGGGVGLCAHASHRVASERCAVRHARGRHRFLPRRRRDLSCCRGCRTASARYLAATGARIEAGDVVALGLAQAFVAERGPRRADDRARGSRADRRRFSTASPRRRRLASSPPRARRSKPGSPGSTGRRMLAALARGGAERRARRGGADGDAREFADQPGDRLAPDGARPRDCHFEEAMRLDFRIVSRICRGQDMYEGVRATIIDKDHAPALAPGPGEPIAEAAIDAYFAPLPAAEELTFPEPALGEDDDAPERRRRDADRRTGVAGAPTAPPPACAAKFYWSDALVWFMRAIAWLWVAKGLFNWGLVLGAFAPLRRLRRAVALAAGLDRFLRRGRSARGCRPVARRALGRRAVASVRVDRDRFAGARRARRGRAARSASGSNVVLVALYFFLTWRAGQERT